MLRGSARPSRRMPSSMVHGSAVVTQATAAFPAIHPDNAASSASRITSLPAFDRVMSEPSLPCSRQARLRRSVEVAIGPRQ